MNIIAVDDEELALRDLCETIEQVCAEDSISRFMQPSKALTFVEEGNPVDLAFLDAEMPGMDGIELARRLLEINADMNIVFVTGYSQYSLDAFDLFASGYLLKPITPEAIERILKNLRHPTHDSSTPLLRVQTFGNFEVFCKERPVHFARSKSKELFAYLVQKHGTSCTTRELCAVLYEDQEYTKALGSQFQTLVSVLNKTLTRCSAENVLIREFNALSIDPVAIECDYYRFLDGDASARSAYTGEFMANYSWAETTNGYLLRMLNKDSRGSRT